MKEISLCLLVKDKNRQYLYMSDPDTTKEVNRS